jgi:hypothetical protein
VELNGDHGVRESQDAVGSGFLAQTGGHRPYKIEYAQQQDAFPDPKWPSRSLEELIEVTFRNASIDTDRHPCLLRLIGAKPDLT